MKNKSLLLNSLAVAFGGFIGGSLRAIMMMLFHSNHFPWETIIVNLSGTLISALLVILLGKLTKLKQITADFVMVGILGAYTTYSTALVDISQLSILPALGYIGVSIVGGVTVVLISRVIGHKLVASW
ncbi:MAG TPA: CrcB family protein [Weissella thailandensis]|uniref:fluoride efflux transporter FluC n=1 Tax=Weissella thailandensis TaxID=89061 RepID=UPI001D9BCE91|nr:CrcB family protein [Weissella thailandensis]HJG84172.1 CrcB family protein [Weissella thailandensis]